MPTYEYACSACKHEWEFEQSIKDDPIKKCPSCRKMTARRQISRGTGFILKGSGWYSDLYSGSSNQSGGSGGSGGGVTSAATESKSSDASSSSSDSASTTTAAPAATKKEPTPKKGSGSGTAAA